MLTKECNGCIHLEALENEEELLIPPCEKCSRYYKDLYQDKKVFKLVIVKEEEF